MSPDKVNGGGPSAMRVQHQHIDELTRELIDLLRLGSGGAEFVAVCVKFRAALASHFSSEEMMLEATAFSGLEQHAKRHREILEQVDLAILNLRRMNSTQAKFAFMEEVENSLYSHELIDDIDCWDRKAR